MIPGMASLIFDSVAVDVSHLKKAKEGPFKGLRAFGWNKPNISDQKIFYTALDAVMVFPVFYKVLKHWLCRYNKGDILNGEDVSWDSILSKILSPLKNRIRRGGSERFASVERDPLLQTSGISKSIHASELPIHNRKKNVMKSMDVKAFDSSV